MSEKGNNLKHQCDSLSPLVFVSIFVQFYFYLAGELSGIWNAIATRPLQGTGS